MLFVVLGLTAQNVHRLNGSSSRVNGDISFIWERDVIWEGQKFDPHRIETPNLIEIKFGTVDYVREATPCAKFYASPSMGHMSEIYAKIL